MVPRMSVAVLLVALSAACASAPGVWLDTGQGAPWEYRPTSSSKSVEELKEAGQRFAHRVGPEMARVFVLAVTVAVSHGMAGGSVLLASRLSKLPHFPRVAAAGAARVGINLASVGEVSAVAVMTKSSLGLRPTAKQRPRSSRPS
jgi:hypothetical protein